VLEQYLSWLSYPTRILLPGILRDRHFSPEIASEISGIAAALNVSEDHMLLYNFMYESAALCTSIVAKAEDGTIIHGRTLDYEFTESLGNLIFEAEFYRGGVLLYKAPIFAGIIGIATAFKSGGFSLSINQRDLPTWLDTVYSAWKGNIGNMFAMRHAIETFDKFTDAVSYLSSVKTTAGCYYIVAGTT
jgi:hypothetical protein